MKNINLITIGLLTALSTVLISLPGQAVPEKENSTRQPELPLTINQVIEKAFYQNSDDIYGISTMGGALNDFFGWAAFPEGSYPENQILRDARLFTTIHQDLWKQQTQTTENIRSQDLKNPYCASIQTGIELTCK